MLCGIVPRGLPPSTEALICDISNSGKSIAFSSADLTAGARVFLLVRVVPSRSSASNLILFIVTSYILRAKAVHTTAFTFSVSCRADSSAVEYESVAKVIAFFRGRSRRANSIFFWSFKLCKPSRLVIRIQCVSTTTAGLPKISPHTRLAVFLPIPGNFIKSSILSGTTPPKSSQSIFAIATMSFDFVL